VPIGLIRRARRERSSANVIDTLTALKVGADLLGVTDLLTRVLAQQ